MTLDPIFWWPIIALLSAGLVALSFYSYRPDTPSRWFLLALRLAAVAIVIGVMLRPSIVYTRQQLLTSTLAIAVDKSRSMQLKDEAAGRSRADAIRVDVEQAIDAIKKLEERVRIRWFEIGASVAETSLDDVLDSSSEQDRSALGDSLSTVHDQLTGDRLAGIVLMTDGANTTGSSPLNVARQFRSIKTPIHTFGYGQEVVTEQARDLIARNIRTNPTVFAKNKLRVVGEFDTSGFANDRVDVRLLLDGVEAARSEFIATAGSTRMLAELEAVPMTPGDVKVTLEASVNGDRQLNNNAISTFVTVLSGGLSVLEIEGKYRYWEPKFLRWALDQSPDIELSQLFLLEQPDRPNFVPADVFEPGRFDVIIIGDINAKHFDQASLERLVEAVEKRGIGLLMMGGYESFGPGGWAQSPLAALMPITMGPGDAQKTDPLGMEPTDAGLRHFILRLTGDPSTNLEAWRSLKPLDGASSWQDLKPGAQLLAQSTSGAPLLAAQNVGAGRTAAFAGDTTWRWRRDKTSIAHHARFWRQLILWLAKKEESGEASLKVSIPTRRLAVGQSLPIVVRAEDANGNAIASAQVQGVVETADGKRMPVELFRQGDEFRGNFWQTDAPGDMTLEVTGNADGSDLGIARTKFLIYAEDLESQQPAADLALLRSIAELTGGTFHQHLQLAEFLESLQTKDLNLEVSQPVVWSLWDRPETLALFLALMTLEWVLRKRRGLV